MIWSLIKLERKRKNVYEKSFFLKAYFLGFSNIFSTLFLNSFSLRFACEKILILLNNFRLYYIFECRIDHFFCRLKLLMGNILKMSESLFLETFKITLNFLFFWELFFFFFLNLFFYLLLMLLPKLFYLFFCKLNLLFG